MLIKLPSDLVHDFILEIVLAQQSHFLFHKDAWNPVTITQWYCYWLPDIANITQLYSVTPNKAMFHASELPLVLNDAKFHAKSSSLPTGLTILIMLHHFPDSYIQFKQ